MRDFSEELIIPTISLLDMNSKLKCLFVCRKWCRIISHCRILYQQIKFRSPTKFNEAVELFENTGNSGRYVESLIIEECLINFISVLLMPRRFPNLKMLVWSEPLRSATERKRCDLAFEHFSRDYNPYLDKWKSIESLTINKKNDTRLEITQIHTHAQFDPSRC